MSHRGALVRRWSRQDWLAVAVVALAVGFLTGAAVVVDAGAAETTALAADFDSPAAVTSHDSVADARAAAGDGDLVLTLARVDGPAGEATVVGVPPGAADFAERTGLALPAPPQAGTATLGPRAAATGGDAVVGESVQFAGEGGTATVGVERRPASVLPARWYAADPATVERLGPTGALVLSADGGTAPLQSALAFLQLGADRVLGLLGVAAAGAGVVLAVAVFGVTRVTVRERRRTVRAMRATGATARAVLALFGARAAAQTAVGVALGYAVGVVGTNLAVSVAVFLGRPVALATTVSPRVAGLLAPAYLGLVAVGAVGGVLAARPAATRPPARPVGQPRGTRPDGGDESSLRAALRPSLLGWRASVPTAATLAVFVVFAVLAASTYGVVAPLSSTETTTVTQTGATHPFNSNLPREYAGALRAGGADASAETLLLSVRDGQPFLARGANYSAFAGLSDASLVAGRAPRGPGEAVVGRDLARTLDLSPGDRVAVGGSTTAAVDRVTVVGVFAAAEPYDDQLVVPLATAAPLAGKAPGTVHLVRTDSVPEGGDGIIVLGVDAPGTATAGSRVPVAVEVANPTAAERTRTVVATLDDQRRERTVTLPPGDATTVEFAFDAGSPREATLAVADRERTVSVVDGDALQVRTVERAPPGSEPLVTVTDASGVPVAGATVAVGDATRETGSDGRTRVPLTATGETTVVATAGERRATTTVDVREGLPRRPSVAVDVAPATPTVTTAPTARVRLANPWNATVDGRLTVAGPGTETTREFALGPGETATVAADLPRRPPGQYAVAVTFDGATVATTGYEVVGDARLSASLAAGGRDASGGLADAAQAVFGNLELILGTLVGLAALTTVGGTTAAFAGAVHARRRTLGVRRATGATPGQVLRLVLGDALVVGAVGTVGALALAGAALLALDAAGLLTVYGVRLLTAVPPVVVAGAAAGALALALLGATLATWAVIRAPPAALLAGTTRSGPSGEAGGDRRA